MATCLYLVVLYFFWGGAWGLFVFLVSLALNYFSRFGHLQSCHWQTFIHWVSFFKLRHALHFVPPDSLVPCHSLDHTFLLRFITASHVFGLPHQIRTFLMQKPSKSSNIILTMSKLFYSLVAFLGSLAVR